MLKSKNGAPVRNRTKRKGKTALSLTLLTVLCASVLSSGSFAYADTAEESSAEISVAGEVKPAIPDVSDAEYSENGERGEDESFPEEPEEGSSGEPSGEEPESDEDLPASDDYEKDSVIDIDNEPFEADESVLFDDDLPGEDQAAEMPDENEDDLGTEESDDDEEDETEDSDEAELVETIDAKDAEFSTDIVLENYIRENADPGLVGSVEQLDLVNGMVVKNTLIDGSMVNSSDTIDSIMYGVESFDMSQYSKILGQIESLVAVYDVNEDSAYYIASANTMRDAAAVWDYEFALYDNGGHVVDGCIYDSATGLAYIPKRLYIDGDGSYVICRIQLQLMQVIGGSLAWADSSVVSSTLDEDDGEIDIYGSAANIFRMQTTAQADAGLDERDIIVSVNGIPTDEYSYNSSTGEITLNRSSASVQTLSVVTDLGGDTAEVLPEITAYASSHTGTVDDMELSKSGTVITIPEWITIGTGLSGTVPVDYNSDNMYGWGADDNDSYAYIDLTSVGKSDVTSLYSWIISSNESLTDRYPTGNYYFHDYYMLFKLEFADTAGKITYDTTVMNNNGAANVYGGDTEPLDQTVDFSALGDLILNCGHVAQSGLAIDEITNTADAEDHLVFLRCVWMNAALDEAVFAVVSGGIGYDGSTEQSGIGLIKLSVQYEESNASLYLHKSSSDPSVTDGNPSYSLAGAVYALYEDAECTTAAVDTDGRIIELTTDADGRSETVELAQGSYYLKEISRPDGYRLDTTVYGPFTVTEENTTENPAVIDVEDTPVYNSLALTVRKIDADTGDASPQAGADLTGAEFTVRYYAGSYSKSEISGLDPTRTWVIKTEESDGNYVAVLDDSHKISGDDLYYSNEGRVVLPLGTYTIAETKAPAGYSISGTFTDQEGRTVEAGEIYYTQYSDDAGIAGSGIWLYGGNEYTQSDRVLLGGVRIQKRDLDSGRTDPEGSASLAGAVFEIINANDTEVLVDGIRFQPGEVVKVLVTDESGSASTASDTLPYGTYRIVETQAPSGYLLGSVLPGSVTESEFEIRENGVIVDLSDPETSFTDQAKRADFSFEKQDGDNQSTDLGSVPFRITSETTGESHIFWTDMNGQYSSSSDWEPHSQNTNAGESYEDGLWFYGYADWEEAGLDYVDDSLGALPYDTYLLEELPCESNSGRTLVTTRFTVYGDNLDLGSRADVHLGTIDNYAYGYSTTAVNGEDGKKYLAADESAEIVDEISYWGLDRSETYRFVTELYDITADDMIRDDDGNVLSVETEFSPRAKDGTETITFFFDATGLEGHSIVVFEYLYGDNGEIVRSEADAENEDQTVCLIGIGTTLVNDWTGEHQATIFENADISLTDTVSYTGLTAGRTYVVRGVLMDRETGDVLLDANGQEVRAESEPFTAESSDGEVDVTFRFFAFGLHGTYTTAFEYLYEAESGELVAQHTDIRDEGQTVELLTPTLWTNAIETYSGRNQIDADEDVSITDLLDLTGLIPGHTYYVYGRAVDTEGNLITDADGNTIELIMEFVADAAEMELDIMKFRFNATGLEGQAVIFEEYLYADPDRNILITEEEDLGALEQTIFFNEAAEEETETVIGTLSSPSGPEIPETPSIKTLLTIRTGDVRTTAWIVVMSAAAASLILAFAMRKRNPKY